jgi:agmatinase
MSSTGATRWPSFLGLTAEAAHPERARVVILPVPYERTSTFGRGSAAGPGALLAASCEVEFYDCVLGEEPWRAAGGVATLPPLALGTDPSEKVAERLQREVAGWLEREKFVITLGGEHTSVVGAIWAHLAAFPDLSILQLDAHSDLRPSYQDDPWNHACAMARALDHAALPDQLVQVGIRSQSRRESEIVRERGIPVLPAHELHAADRCGRDWIGPLLAALRPHVYLTIDCDVFDPSLMPATGTPEPGGLLWHQVDGLLERLCQERRLVGCDFSELMPLRGLAHPEFAMARLVNRIIGRRFGSRREPEDGAAFNERIC